MLPLEELYAFKESFLKYWKKLIKPAFIQSLFGDMIFLVLMLSLWHKMITLVNILSGVFFIWVGFLLAHIVYRCLRGESIYEDYERDD